jgi:hypothetical protein
MKFKWILTWVATIASDDTISVTSSTITVEIETGSLKETYGFFPDDEWSIRSIFGEIISRVDFGDTDTDTEPGARAAGTPEPTTAPKTRGRPKMLSLRRQPPMKAFRRFCSAMHHRRRSLALVAPPAGLWIGRGLVREPLLTIRFYSIRLAQSGRDTHHELCARIKAALDARKAANPADEGKALANWLADSCPVIPGCTYDDATAALLFMTGDALTRAVQQPQIA